MDFVTRLEGAVGIHLGDHDDSHGIFQAFDRCCGLCVVGRVGPVTTREPSGRLDGVVGSCDG